MKKSERRLPMNFSRNAEKYLIAKMKDKVFLSQVLSKKTTSSISY